MGITDVDDKIINRAKDHGLSNMTQVTEMVRSFEANFFADMDALGVARPDAVLRVSEHMPEIINYINTISKNGYSYAVSDGVYFDVNKLGDRYGQLGNIPPTSMAETIDVDNGSAGTKYTAQFM
jgi:cysteinyl-tRNA synthetase